MFTFEHRCRIEARFPQVANAYDLTMGEFLDRLRLVYELDEEQQGGGADPLMAHLKAAHKQMMRS